MFFQMFTQLAPRFVHTPRHCSFRTIEHLCGFFVAHSVNTNQNERCPKRVRKLIDAVTQRLGQFAIMRNTRRIRAVRRALLHEKRFDARIVRRKRISPRFSGSNDVERQIDRNPIQPGKRFASTIETIERLVGPDKGLLRHVLCLRALTHEMEREAKNTPLVTLHERSERLRVPRTCLLHELTIGRFAHLGQLAGP